MTSNNLALLIGINYTGTGSQLEGCHNDVHHMKAYLLSKGYQEKNIHTLMDTPENKSTEFFPHKKNILAAMKKLIIDAKNLAANQVFVHYSGHGGYTVDRDSDEKDRRDECIYPIEENGQLEKIIDDDLKSVLVNDLPDQCKLRVVLDCCHSGTAMDLTYRYIPNRGVYREHSKQDTKDVVCISGCHDDQTSADAWIDRKNQGALTAHLLKLLKNPLPNWKYKDFAKVLQYKLYKDGYEQVPQLTVCKREDISKILDM